MQAPKIPPQAVAYITVFIIVIWVVYLLLKRIGLIESRQQRVEEKKQAENEKTAIEFFPPNVWKNYPQRIAMDDSNAKQYAKDIKNSFGFWNDDEDKIFATFQKLAYKPNVSQLSDAYEKLYGADLHNSLYQNLNENEMQYIYNIIAIKPTT